MTIEPRYYESQADFAAALERALREHAEAVERERAIRFATSMARAIAYLATRSWPYRRRRAKAPSVAARRRRDR